jgi:hypothetical protein
MKKQIRSSSKKVRGRSRKSIDLIAAMYAAAETAQPITGRGIGYKLFSQGLIPSMDKPSMQGVYRLLKEAREDGTIPWEWIVDETRALEKVSTWEDPEAFVETVHRAYRRDFWAHQPCRVEVWSEKGTVRGVLQPTLDEYGVGFRVMHGFSSATTVNDVAQDGDGRPLIVLYVGDYDPSGMFMSEKDLPERLDRYGGDHIELRRIALRKRDCTALGDRPSFRAAEKRSDPRYPWFVKRYGQRCWELDAMDPNALRARVDQEIRANIEPKAWERCAIVDAAERESLRHVLDRWQAPGTR